MLEEDSQRSLDKHPIPLDMLPTPLPPAVHRSYEDSGSAVMEYASVSLPSTTRASLHQPNPLKSSKTSSSSLPNSQGRHVIDATAETLNECHSISRPPSTRRYEGSIEQRQYLVPVRLGPVVLRDVAPAVAEPLTMKSISEEASDECSNSSHNSLSERSIQEKLSTDPLRPSDDVLPRQLPIASRLLQGASSDQLPRISGTAWKELSSSQPPLSTRSSSSSCRNETYLNSIPSAAVRSTTDRSRTRSREKYDRTRSTTYTLAASHTSERNTSPTRVSDWLSRPSTSSSSLQVIPNDMLRDIDAGQYPQSCSELSICYSLTETSSPSLTATSSTKGHSRSPTEDSQRTCGAAAPQYSIHEVDLGDKYILHEKNWLPRSESQYGLAI